MYIHDEYYFWRIAYQLMMKNQFELMQVNERNHEIWFQKTINKQSVVVRLFMRNFDWANHLKRDVSSVLGRVKNIQNSLRKKEVVIHNLYISELAPVDDWESVKKPLQLKDKKNIFIHTYYLDEQNRMAELQRFFSFIDAEAPGLTVLDNEEEIVRQIQQIKQNMMNKHHEQKREIASLFNHGKPVLTYLLIAINVLIFYFLEQQPGGSTSTQNLIDWGAKFNPYILDGEWWRVLSSMFLHIGFAHIIMNMLALYYLGNTVERMFGSVKFFFIYFLAGIFGGVASFAFNDSVAAGASGAIFGLFGALLFFGFENKKLFFQTMGTNLLFIIGLNIAMGLSVPSIDNGAHMGGLAGGFLAAAIVQMPKRRRFILRIASLALYVIAIAGLFLYGTERSDAASNPQTAIIEANEHLENQEYEKMIDVLTPVIKQDNHENEILYFNRSIGHYYLDNLNQAKEDLQAAIDINPEFADAHFNLALVHRDLGNYNKAYEHAEEAVRLKPNNEDFQDFKRNLSEFRNSLN
ncbi:rhomboid protease GluP [Salinibacillus kushneri]|uniref:Rhomboid protease GluP n=1 Tax=Salinibacillus kushneri TaxID=237682 RepID=A0A1I0FVW2_9BACI|nr:rhomboid family intramembrane serine protease [Salinibacillus kushneri]SET62623.1 rhomboid protease GluP [Salinibacillus kushneri]